MPVRCGTFISNGYRLQHFGRLSVNMHSAGLLFEVSCINSGINVATFNVVRVAQTFCGILFHKFKTAFSIRSIVKCDDKDVFVGVEFLAEVY